MDSDEELCHDDDINWEPETRSEIHLFLESIPEESLRILNLTRSDIVQVNISFPEGFRLETMPAHTIKNAQGLEQLIKFTIRDFTLNFKGKAFEQFIESLQVELQNRIENCHKYCPLCNELHEFPPVKLVPCSKGFCQWRFSEMGVGTGPEYELKNYPSIVDLLISTTYLAVISKLREHVLNPFPERFLLADKKKDYDRITKIIGSFPSVQKMTSLINDEDNKSLMTAVNKTDPDAYYLLRWILFSNRSHIRPISCDEIRKKVPSLTVTYINAAFEFGSLPPEKELEFQNRKAEKGSIFAFHGSPSGNWHSIIRNFLAVFSGTVMQLHGAVHGKGIYFATNQGTAAGYATTTPAYDTGSAVAASWTGSTFKSQRMMLIAEVIKDKIKDFSWCFTVDDARDVATRYLIVF